MKAAEKRAVLAALKTRAPKRPSRSGRTQPAEVTVTAGTSAHASEGKLALTKPVRETDPQYLAWLRTQPCCVGMVCSGPVEASHLRTRGAGGSDYDAVPHCHAHHAKWHSMGRETFNKHYGNQEFLADVYVARYRRGLQSA